MKTITLVLTIATLCASRLAAMTVAQPPVAEGQWKEERYAVWVKSPAHLRAVQWKPEKEDPPLSIRSALAAARAALKKFVGDAHGVFECEAVKLQQGPTNDWFYTVTFSSVDLSVATKAEVGISPAILPFVVYLDATVEIPEKKKG